MPFDFLGGAFDIGEASTAFNAAEQAGLDSVSAAAEAGISSANAGDFAVGTDGLIGSAIPGAGGVPGADGTLIVDYDQPFVGQSVQPGLAAGDGSPTFDYETPVSSQSVNVNAAGSVDGGGVYDFQGPNAGVQTDYAAPVDVNNSAAESARLAALNENGLPVSQPNLVDQITGRASLIADQVKAAGANAVASLTTQIQAEIPKLITQAKQQLIGQTVGAATGAVKSYVAGALPAPLAKVANNVIDKAANNTASALGANSVPATDVVNYGGGGDGGNGLTGATFAGDGGAAPVTAAGLLDAATTDIKNYGNQLYSDTARGIKSFAAGIVSSTTATGQNAETNAAGIAQAIADSEIAARNSLNTQAAVEATAAEAYSKTLLAQRQQVLATQRKIANNGDWRVRLTLAPGSDYLYNDPDADLNRGILWPLAQSGGVIFPYTPKISTSYTAEYTPTSLTHTNYKNYFYQSSSVGEISITAKFTAQDTTEAQYLLAVIHFFRSVTKMFYGKDPQRGAPPPLVFLTGYGQFQFQNHPCVVSKFGYELPDNVDYIRARSENVNGMNLLTRRDRPVAVPGDPISGAYKRLSDLFSGQGINRGAQSNSSTTALPPPPTLGLNNPTYVPTSMDITITLLPVMSRSQVSQQFSLKNFANGQLLAGGFW